MMRRGVAGRRGSRDVAELLADFGHRLPARPPVPSDVREPGLFDQVVASRGRMQRYSGWAPVPAPLSAWRMTSEQAPGLWPFVAPNGLRPTGAFMGFDLASGGAFYADPMGWVVDDEVPVTAPNMSVDGMPGFGKSALIKTLCLRSMPYGYRTLISGDIKDEYELFCRMLGVEPFAIGPGMSTRLNPLDMGPLGHNWANLAIAERARRATLIFARWLVLLKGLVGSQSVPFTPTENTVVSEALHMLTGYAAGSDRLAPVTVPALWRALDEPTDQLVSVCRFSGRQHFLDQTAGLRNALRTLVKGHMAGMFDAETNFQIDWRAPIQSLSLSRLEMLGDEALGVALTCTNSWSRAMREIAEPGDLRIVVRDEAWRQLRLGVEAVKSFDADLRLSRRDGDVQIVAYHKPADMLSVGSADSQAVAIAKDILELIPVKVHLAQKHRVASEFGELHGYSQLAQDAITGWAAGAKGRALWSVGGRMHKVQGVLTPLEQRLTYTNENVAAA
jgi:hypothetical protein